MALLGFAGCQAGAGIDGPIDARSDRSASGDPREGGVRGPHTDGHTEASATDAHAHDAGGYDAPLPDGARATADGSHDATLVDEAAFDGGREAREASPLDATPQDATVVDAGGRHDGAPEASPHEGSAGDGAQEAAWGDAMREDAARASDGALEANRPDGAGVDATHDAHTDVAAPAGPPATFGPGQVNIEVDVFTAEGRAPISPLIYGINADTSTGLPASILSSVTLTRRGGDRGNSYNWETNVSNGGLENGYTSDLTFAANLPNQAAPAGQDLADLTSNRAAGRATMVPFVLNDYVAGPVNSNIPWNQAGWNIAAYFNQEVLVKPTPYAATPNLTDGVVYTDEQLAYMRAQFPGDINAPGPTSMLVGIDNEADLWESNFPMLQRGTGAALVASDGVTVGHRVTGPQFTQRVLTFASRVKTVAPTAHIVGPAHFGYDGWECWHDPSQTQWSDLGRWYMDDFLADVSAASAAAGVRLLDTWDFHWYPQATFGGTAVSALDNAASPLTAAEVQAIVQGPRSYWDTTYDEGSWITSQYHLNGPAYIITRLQSHIAAGYPGTGLGVSEYFPGGRNHISSGLATVDSLGVFQTMGVELAALWPYGDNAGLTYAFGGIELVHNADGHGLRYADTSVSVSNPEAVQISAYAGMDTPDRVTVLVVNKTTAPIVVGLRITNLSVLSRVSIYRIDAADPAPYLATQDTLALNNADPYSAPALSASMLIFQTP